ncbi:MAG: hypothetical protein VCB25_09410, partial [Myxococcota bacterium]
MPEMSHLTRSSEPKEIWDTLDRDGGVIVDDFIAPELLDSLREELMPFVERHRHGASPDDEPFWQDFHGTNTKRITGLCEKSA